MANNEILKKLIYAADATPDPVIITEAEPLSLPGPKIIYVNDMLCAQTGYTKDELYGKTPRILQSEKTDKEISKKLREDLMKWKLSSATLLNVKKNGEEFYTDLHIKPIPDENGWYQYWFSVQRDVTEKILAENFIKEQQKLLINERNKVFQAKEAQSNFLMNMSHELRTPLNAVIGFSELIERQIHGSCNENYIEYARYIKEGGQKLLKDLNDLLILSKAQITPDKFELTNIENLLVKICKFIEASFINENFKIEYKYKGKINEIIFDSERAKTILLNLCTNSVKYKKKNIKSFIKITAIYNDSKKTIDFEIYDNGIGMPESFHKKATKLFERGNVKKDGLGIGLSIVKTLLLDVGEDLKIESKTGAYSYTKMRFSLPILEN